ncbi:MAG TPA: thiamine pyrophosphate-dependent enzyme [Terriglobales bacterium]|nr:thiamine pyrophosphate-dependent enzyme [Terriglobales bacterium]
MSSRPQPKLTTSAGKPAAKAGAEAPASAARRFPLDAATLNHYLRQMVTLREFEHLGEREFKNGLVRGYYHSYAGQEAVGVGFVNALDLRRDYIVDHYRDHGHMLLSGMDPMRIYAELFGRSTGVSKGKGGSMHMYSPEDHFLGGDGIVGGGISVSTGVGLALKQQKQDGICVCFFGDGALDTGTFHESLNMASLWGVPTVYICINNKYSMGTSLERHSSLPRLVDRAQGYGIPTEQVDGQDVWATTEAAERIFRQVRQRQQPYFVEALTYRYQGHGIHDKALNYRTLEEETAWHARDPLKLLADFLIEEKLLTAAQIESLRAEVVAELEAKVAEAKTGPEPAPEELFHDVTL